MESPHITQNMLESANKLTYLIKAYPEKYVDQIVALFQMPRIDTNCAIWVARELKWIEMYEAMGDVPKVDPKTGRPDMFNTERKMVTYARVISEPDHWQFGEVVEEVENLITYAFEKLNAEEKDLEENYLGGQTAGYATHDTLIAVKQLLEDNVLHEYELEDGENAYIFYTLKKNEGKNWGQKQFKTNPLTGEDQRTDEQKAADEKAAQDKEAAPDTTEK